MSASTSGATSDTADSGAPTMIDCGPNACVAGQVCVVTEACCGEVDYACTEVPEVCEGQSGAPLAACVCSDTPVGHEPATGVVSCQNFGCTTGCGNGEAGPLDETGEPQISCGDQLCEPGDLCIETATCCNVTDHACTPPQLRCGGLTGAALAECMCLDSPVGYDAESSTVLCENSGCTTSCPGDSDTSETATVDTGNASASATDTGDECTCFSKDECASPPAWGEPCMVDGECCPDVDDFFLVCDAGVWAWDCTFG